MAPFSGGGNPSGYSTSPGPVYDNTVLGGSENPFMPQFPGGPTAPSNTFPGFMQPHPDSTVYRGGEQKSVPLGAGGNNRSGDGGSPGSMPEPSDPSQSGLGSTPLTGPGLFTPVAPAQQPAPGFPANGVASSTNLAGFPPVGGGTSGLTSLGNIPGMTPQMSQLLLNFLQSGAGFNPQVAQAMINALQPQVQEGEENLIEQFSTGGQRNSSSAQVGLGDYLSQVNLNEQQIFAQMYEQSTQNYLEALGLGKTQPLPSGLGALIGGIGQLGQGVGSIIGNWPGNDSG